MSKRELAELMGDKSEAAFILEEVLAKWVFDIEGGAAALPLKGYTRWISPDGKYRIGIHQHENGSVDIFAFENVENDTFIGVFHGRTQNL